MRRADERREVPPVGGVGDERFLSLASTLPVGIFVAERPGRTTWINPRCQEICGCTVEEARGRGWVDRVHPEDRRAAMQGWTRAAEAGRPWQAEIRFRHRDGTVRWVVCRSVPRRSADRVVEHVGTVEDVTDRRRDEVLLAGNRDALARFAEDAPLGVVLDEVTAMVEAQSQHGALASILLVGEDGRSLRHGSAPSLPAAYNQAIDGIAIGPAMGSCGTAAHRGEQVVADDIATDVRWAQWRELAMTAGLRACWSTPIFAADGGLLATFATYYHEPRSPGPDDQRLIEQVTRTVAVAIQHDRVRRTMDAAVATAEAAAARSRRLEDLAARLSGALAPEQVAQISADYAMQALGAQAAWFGLLDPDGGHLELSWAPGFPPELTARFARVPVTAPLAFADVARTGTARWLSSEAEVVAELPLLAGVHPGVGSVALLPLRARGHTFGSLGLCRDRPGAFDSEERGEAMAVAAQCAQAMQRAARFAASNQIAEAFQRSLLTDPPQPGELTLAVRYRPAVAAAEVGGDWYDAFVLPDGSLALTIGDVVGHDLSAAATMGQLRTMLRTLACDSGGQPAAVLGRMDRLTDQLGVTDLTSLIFAKIEGPDGGPRLLRWTNAGHPPPLLVLPDGSTHLLDDLADPPLGVSPTSHRTDAVAQLPGGCTVLLYTDGLVETRQDPLDQRIALLRDHAAKQAGAPLEAFCDAVLGFVVEPADDVALLAVRIPAD